MTAPHQRHSLSPLQIAIRVNEAVRAADLAADLVAHVPAADPAQHDILVSIAAQITGAARRLLNTVKPFAAPKRRKPRAQAGKARA